MNADQYSRQQKRMDQYRRLTIELENVDEAARSLKGCYMDSGERNAIPMDYIKICVDGREYVIYDNTCESIAKSLIAFLEHERDRMLAERDQI